MQLVEFTNSPADVIRSVTQFRLLQHWRCLRGARQLPPAGALNVEEIADLSANLLMTEVVHAENNVRFMICFNGARIAESFGVSSPDWCKGRFLDDVLPSAYCAAAHSTFHHVVVVRKPLYTVADMRDRAGRIVHYERLLLPFGRDGVAVDHILASLEAVSPEGAFENRDLMKAPSRPPAFALCTTIDVGNDTQ